MPDSSDLPGPRTIVTLAILVEGGLGILAAAIGWLIGEPPLWMIRANLADLLLGALAAVPLVGGGYLLMRRPPPFLQPLRELVDTLVAPMFRGCTVLELAAVSALAGLGEEMLFRGVIQHSLAAGIGGTGGLWIGLLVASALFGAAHAISPWYAVLAGLTGVYLGGLWLASDNLLVPVVAHGLYDFVALVYLVKIREAAKQGEL